MGLTGGIACGKSAAASALEELGAKVLDADAVIHRLYEPSALGAKAVAEIAGAGALDPEGRVDRKRLAEIVYRDKTFRREIEKRVHPLVREELGRWLASLRAELLPFFSAALLVETGFCDRFPVVVCVTCPKSMQVARLLRRDPSLSEVDATQRIEAQMTLEEKQARCGGLRLIENDTGFDELRQRCRLLYRELMHEKQLAEAG